MGVCKVRFNRGGRLYAPWGYVGGCSATPSRRSRSFTPCRGRSPTASGCSVATCTAATARIGSPRRLFAHSRAAVPPLDVSPSELVDRRAGSARACSSAGTTSRSSRRSGPSLCSVRRSGPACGLRSCRTATARPRSSSTSGRGSTTTRSTSRASTTATIDDWGTARAVLETIRWLQTSGVSLEIDRTLLVPGFNDSDEEVTALYALSRRLTTDPLARHGVPSGLQDDRSPRHDRRHAAARGIDRYPRRAPVCLRRQPARPRRRVRAHPMSLGAASRSSSGSAISSSPIG